MTMEQVAEDKIQALQLSELERGEAEEARFEAEAKRATATKKRREEVLSQVRARHQAENRAFQEEERRRGTIREAHKALQQEESEEIEEEWQATLTSLRQENKDRLLAEQRRDEEEENQRLRKAEKEDDLIQSELNREIARLTKEASAAAAAAATSAASSSASSSNTADTAQPKPKLSRSSTLDLLDAPEPDPEPGTHPDVVPVQPIRDQARPTQGTGAATRDTLLLPPGPAEETPQSATSSPVPQASSLRPKRDAVARSRSHSLTASALPSREDLYRVADLQIKVEPPAENSGPSIATPTSERAPSPPPPSALITSLAAAAKGAHSSSRRAERRKSEIIPPNTLLAPSTFSPSTPAAMLTPASSTMATKRGQVASRYAPGGPSVPVSPATSSAASILSKINQQRQPPHSSQQPPQLQLPPQAKPAQAQPKMRKSTSEEIATKERETTLAMHKYEEHPQELEARLRLLQSDMGVAHPGKIDPNLWTSIATDSSSATSATSSNTPASSLATAPPSSTFTPSSTTTTPAPTSTSTPKEPPESGKRRSSLVKFSGTGDVCSLCQKVAYPVEKIEVDKRVYHKTCFRCTQCKIILQPGNHASAEGILYCKPHFLQLFALKGNYDEGFGRQPKSKKLSNPEGLTTGHK